MKYITEDYETGTAIDEFDTYAEAMNAVAGYESADRADGTYSEGFYAIRHGEDLDRIYRAADSMDQARRLTYSRMGQARTSRKAAASRENGKKGGRPRKNAEK